MIWKKTDSRTKLGVAIYNFKDNGEHNIQLDIGDTVHILEEADDWFRGYVTKNKSKKGIFPRNYVRLKEATVHIVGSHEAIKSKEHPLVIELSNVVREWHTIWRQMFVENNPLLDKVQKKIADLIEWRKKIMARDFTIDQMKGVQQDVSSLIDQGNALLKLDLVVRDEQGNILNPEETSIIEMYQAHIDAAERIQKETTKRDSDIEVRPHSTSSFNLFVLMRNFVCKIGEDSDIMMNLYDAREERFISENFTVQWSKSGVPKDIENINNFPVVFTDLGIKDKAREKVYLVLQIIRIGVMDPKLADNKKQTQGIRRPFGVAVMDISEVIQKGTKPGNEDIQHFIPYLQCTEKEFLFNVVKKAITAKDINHRGQGIWVSLKVLHGDMKQVKENYPHLVTPGTAFARKMGFPDVIMPGDVRNDIYLTIRQGEFTKGPTKTSDKNVQVLVQICDKNGKVVEDVISQGCNDANESEYKSIVYYHEDKPKWFETVKIAISVEENFQGLHLKFLFRHKSSSEAKDRAEKPYAMSYIKLINESGTTLQDKLHELLVYKIEGRRHDDVNAYFKLPSTKQELEARGSAPIHKHTGSFTFSQKDAFFVETYVCSTKLTHNVDLLGLLKWHEKLHDTKALRGHLENLLQEEGEEIVKFLQDLLDALFNILLGNTNSELCDNLVFDALVYIIALISAPKYSQFRPVLDVYIDSTFGFTMAYNKLMVILKDYVDKANEKQAPQGTGPGGGALLRAIKSLEYIFKFIIKSRILFSHLNDGRGKLQFEISLKQLITAINNMMVYVSSDTLPLQGAALKYISSIIGDVMTVFDPVELSYLLVQFIENVPAERLTKQKIMCIDNLIQTELFTLPRCRQILLPAFLQHIHRLMEATEEMEECVSMLSHTMVRLWSCDSSRDTDIHILMSEVLRTVIQAVIKMDTCMKQVGSCVAVMMSLLRQMTDLHYRTYIQNFPTKFDLIDFLMEILMVFRDLVRRKVYPGDWLEMTMMQNSVILRALRFFAATIHEHFSSPFDQQAQQLWNNFFHCAIDFLTQDALQLDNFSVSKKNKIISRYKDMRRETGFEIRAMWFKLGANKINFIPELVGPFLEMTLIPDTELRKATIPIFHDMMQDEFMQPVPNSTCVQGNFNEFENEMITKLDQLVEGGKGDEQYMELFTEIMEQLCQGSSVLSEPSLQFVEVIHGLLERLMVYRTIMQEEVREHRMSCIVNLLDFYHDINRQEMYIRYLHKLRDLHLGCDNYTEAGYTLMLFARLLQWNNEPLAPMLHYDQYPEAVTHQELKERLYYDIIKCFEDGKMWEKGIELCDELCRIYREEMFDYKSLSDCLKRQAKLYDSILNSLRPEPEYFRVGYFGQGFPSFLQNKVFVYRGKEYERISDFNARMQTLFPRAELMATLDVPSEEIRNSNKQFLQINNVTPVMDTKSQFNDRNINEQILKYYKVNDVMLFTFSRRLGKANDVTKMWLERTTLKTSYSLPGIVSWFQVIDVDVISISPIMNAIETMEDKNKKMLSCVESHTQDPSLNINTLSMQLNGVVDAAVAGGIANYKDFYIGEYDAILQDRLKDSTIEQMSILRDGLMVHKKKAPETLMPLQENMEKKFHQMCASLEDEYDIKVTDKAFTNGTLRRNMSLPGSANRMSDLSVHSINISPDRRKYDTMRAPSPAKPPTSASRSQSVFVKDRSGSVASTSDPRSKISLQSKLTPKRPPRPDTERKTSSRPPSSQMKLDREKSGSALSLGAVSRSGSLYTLRMSDASDADSQSEPPPLPDKMSHGDDVVRRQSSVSQAGNRQKPPPPPPPHVEEDDGDTPPAIPPKPSHSHC